MRLSKQLQDVKPTTIKRKRASTKTTLVDGVTRITKRHSIKFTQADVIAHQNRKMWNDVSIAKDDVVKRANSAGGWRS